MGAGPYPTEIFDQLAEDLRAIGKEYGTTTGRPRRIGWMDMVALRYVIRCVPAQCGVHVALGSEVQLEPGV